MRKRSVEKEVLGGGTALMGEPVSNKENKVAPQ